MEYFGNTILILDQSGGSGFVCSSEIKQGNAMEKLLKMDENYNVDERQEIVFQTTKNN